MNLNTATNEQLEEYRTKTAGILKIDPFMLDFIWMNDAETGLKNRVLYAKRGAAEVLRQNLGISILSMEHYESSGWLMFTAIGKDAKGRQEIAHGAAYVEGAKADKKAHSVMTASTRALRRLTLQFVAGGILDESEVQAQSSLSVAPAASEATLAGSPTVIPKIPDSPDTRHAQAFAPVANMGEHIAKVYEDGAKGLEKMRVNQCLAIPPIPLTTPSETISNENSVRTKRLYRRKNQVDISSPGQQTEIPAGYLDTNGKITSISVPPATAKDTEQRTVGNEQIHPSALAEPAIDAVAEHVKESMTIAKIAVSACAPPVQVNPTPSIVLSKEKQDEYRTRLSKYYNDILPRGGMQSSESIGGPTMKTRKFAAIHTGVADTKQMTEQHWEDLFEFLDSHASNPKFLVEYINKALGVA
jgi:hypothetical protein